MRQLWRQIFLRMPLRIRNGYKLSNPRANIHKHELMRSTVRLGVALRLRWMNFLFNLGATCTSLGT